jgi:ubiquinone/menaquinone biosynthesis C-methylase UbiE
MDESSQAAAVYGKIARKYFETFSNPSDYISSFLRMVKKCGTILDAGCGPGVDSAYMNEKGFHVIGMDFSKDMISLAKSKFPLIDFREGDSRNSGFCNEYFDGILASYLLNYIPKRDISKTLQEFHRIMRANAPLYVAVQEGPSQEIYEPEPLKPDEKLFVNVFSREEIIDGLDMARFSIKKVLSRKSKSPEELSYNKLFILARKSL